MLPVGAAMAARHGWVAAALLVATACGGASSPTTPRAAATSPAAAMTSPDLSVTLPAGDAPINPLVADGSVWVAAHHAAAVVRIDAATGKVLARIATADQPGGGAAGAGLVWFTHYGASHLMVAIDPATNSVVRRIALPGESCCAPAVLDGAVWVTAGGADSPAVVAVDARTGRVGTRIERADGPVTVGTALWVSHDGQRAVVDPGTGTTTPSFVPPGVGAATGVAADGLVWGTRAGSLVGISPDGSVGRRITGPKEGRLFYGDDATALPSADEVWLTDGSANLWRLSPGADLRLVATFPGQQAVSLAGDGKGGVWAVLFTAGTVLHFAARP